jgi:hypothetical protein
MIKNKNRIEFTKPNFKYWGGRIIQDSYSVKYRCDRCNDQWYQPNIERIGPAKEFLNCRRGCSSFSLWKLPHRMFIFLFTRKPIMGYARFVSEENLINEGTRICPTSNRIERR